MKDCTCNLISFTPSSTAVNLCVSVDILQMEGAQNGSDTSCHNTQQSQENREENERGEKRGGREIRVFNSLIAKKIQDSTGFILIQ